MCFAPVFVTLQAETVIDMQKLSRANIIPVIQQCLTKQPITKAWLFGSYSRGEERPDSDIDLLVQYDPNAKVSLMTISRVMCDLKKATGKEVDVIEDGRLMPFAVESANRDKILIYERAN